MESITRHELMQIVAEKFGYEPDEDGKYDINDYDWTAGCNCDGVWMNASLIVDILEDAMNYVGVSVNGRRN